MSNTGRIPEDKLKQLTSLALEKSGKHQENIYETLAKADLRNPYRMFANTNVLIGVPCSWETIHVPFVKCLMQMYKPDKCAIEFYKASTIDRMRNDLCQIALDGNFSHLFMLDADMIYPQETLFLLLKHGLPVVTGLSCSRKPPNKPVYMPLTDIDVNKEKWVHINYALPPEEGVHEVRAVGGAGTLIDVNVLRNMPRPWFSFKEYLEDGTNVGEDIYFSVMAREAGFRLYCDCSLRYGHILPMAAYVVSANPKEGYQIQYVMFT